MSWSSVPPERREVVRSILTDRQLRVLQDRMNGWSWRKIGAGLHISEATARAHYKAALDRIAEHDAERRNAA